MRTRSIALELLVALCACTASVSRGGSPPLSEATLGRALESGCSFVIVRVMEAPGGDRMHPYRVKIVRTLVAGDLTKEAAGRTWDLFAGMSYGDALRVGSHYAMLIGHESPYELSWTFRDDILEVDPSDEETVKRLVETADRIYAGTAILRFRRARVWTANEPPEVPEELVSLCKQFRDNPGRRAEFGMRIFESDLGSRVDDSRPESSVRVFLPPRILCSRRQIVSLLGYPTWISGWTYSWQCDDRVNPREAGGEIGVLSATFDPNERAVRVLYSMQERSKWLRPRRSADSFSEAEGDSAGVARHFQEAMSESDWERALSYCSERVKAEAARSGSKEAFFKRFVPIVQIVARPEFKPQEFSRRDGNTTRMSVQVAIPVSGQPWPVDWIWSLERTGQNWSVDFKPVPLDIFIRKELLKREFMERPTRMKSEEYARAVEFRLSPLGDEFVIGRPMRFKVEMSNVRDDPVPYTQSGGVMANDPMLVTDPNGQVVPYVDVSYQIGVMRDVILPGETVVLAGDYDVTPQYRIVQPGRYRFQFRGWPRGSEPSNVCEVEVKPGGLSDVDRISEKLLAVMPAGWRFERRVSLSRGEEDAPGAGGLYVNLIGRHQGKGGDEGVFLVILKATDPTDTDPWLKEVFDLWGLSSWGLVYARANEAEPLWPDSRADIVRVLEIGAPRQIEVAELIRRATLSTKNGVFERQARYRLVEIGDAAVPAVAGWLEREEARLGPEDSWNRYAAMVDVLSQIGSPEALRFLSPDRAHLGVMQFEPYRAMLLRRVEIWQSEDRFDKLLGLLEDRKWAIFKLGILGDARAIGPLESVAAEDEEMDIRETAKDALIHLRDPNIPMRYVYHSPSQEMELTAAESYRVGEPVKIRCAITGGEYGGRALVEFASPQRHFLPWGFEGPDLGRCRPFCLSVDCKRGRAYDELQASETHVSTTQFGAATRLTLKPGESRVYEFEDLRDAYDLSQPGEYRVHVASSGYVLSEFLSFTIRPAANGLLSQP